MKLHFLGANRQVTGSCYYLEAAGEVAAPGRLVALVSPHAGLRYSGPVAAYGYRLLEGRSPLTVATSRDDGRTWVNIKDIETDPTWEFTNPSCYVTSQDKVIIAYVASPMDNPDPPGRLGRSHMPMKMAIADLQWFYQ